MVQEVGNGPAMREFVDLGITLGGDRPGIGWSMAEQRRRLRNLDPPGGDAALLLARRGGRAVGRLTAHRQAAGQASGGEGSFGFLVIERQGDLDVLEGLLDAAGSWLVDRGGTTLLGPLSWTSSEEAGVLVAGHDEPPVTGRAWTPPWYGALLEAAGLAVADEMCSFRLSAEVEGGAGAAALTPAAFSVPRELMRFADPALLLSHPGGGGSVVAVPDVVGGLAVGRAGERGRGAWSLASQARRRAWTGCVVLAVDGPESVLIPGLCAAARRAGYAWVLSPWAPDGRRPVMRHRLYRTDVASAGTLEADGGNR